MLVGQLSCDKWSAEEMLQSRGGPFWPRAWRPGSDIAMETCVLIPSEFSLVLTATSEPTSQRLYDTGVRVWSNNRIARGTRFYPFQGTIRLDKLEVYGYLDKNDIRNRFGCYDEVQVEDRRRVRHCNWIRFLRFALTPGPDVNLVGTRVKGEPVFEATRTVGPNTELVAFVGEDEEERDNGDLLLRSAERLAGCSYREAMGMLIEQSPLDLSMALLSSRILITSPSDAEGSLSPSSDVSPLLPRVPSVSPLPRRGRERSLLPCEVCGKAFDRPSLLKRHMRTHTGEKPHVCDVCGKGFSTSSSLNTHRRIHSGEKPHQCSVCGKRFTASSNLYYHRMTHNKEKPHKCTLCSKSFPTPGDLKSHMYVHSGTWPFKCHICNRGFSKQTNLKNHLFLHTGDKPHVCELCSKRFALACNLRAHMKTHEDDPQEECIKCNRPFLASNNLLIHGYCDRCYHHNQGIPLIVRKATISQSGSETMSETIMVPEASDSMTKEHLLDEDDDDDDDEEDEDVDEEDNFTDEGSSISAIIPLSPDVLQSAPPHAIVGIGLSVPRTQIKAEDAVTR